MYNKETVNSIAGLLHLEQLHFEQMVVLMKIYANALLEAAIMPVQLHNDVFTNLEQYTQLHAEFLAALQHVHDQQARDIRRSPLLASTRRSSEAMGELCKHV